MVIQYSGKIDAREIHTGDLVEVDGEIFTVLRVFLYVLMPSEFDLRSCQTNTCSVYRRNIDDIEKHWSLKQMVKQHV